MQLQLEALQILAKSEAHVSSELPMEDIPFLSWISTDYIQILQNISFI